MAPYTSEKVPGGHWVQEPAPGALAYVPGWHCRQWLLLLLPVAATYVPAGQSAHTAAPVPGSGTWPYWPAGHAVHCAADVAPEPAVVVPTGHPWQATELLPRRCAL